jgi:hypothetical protein
MIPRFLQSLVTSDEQKSNHPHDIDRLREPPVAWQSASTSLVLSTVRGHRDGQPGVGVCGSARWKLQLIVRVTAAP